MLGKERGRTVGQDRGQVTKAGKGKNKQYGNGLVRTETGRPKK